MTRLERDVELARRSWRWRGWRPTRWPNCPSSVTAEAERGALEEGDNAVGLGSANHPFAVLADADITPRGAQAVKENDDEPVPEPSLGIPLKRDDRTR